MLPKWASQVFSLISFVWHVEGNLYTYQIGLVGLHHSSYRVSARLSVRVVAASAPGFGALKDGTAEVQHHDTACTFA